MANIKTIIFGFSMFLLVFISLSFNVLATDISACGVLNSEGDVYTLTQNVNTTDTCFTITANNVTLDCQSYEINYSSNGGNTEYGVYSTYNLTTIKNCIIKEGAIAGNYDYGIYFNNASNGTINNNTITTSGSYGYGIYLYTSSNSNTLSNNTITTSGSYGYGIYLYTSSNSNTLSNNTITTSGSSGYGIYLEESSNITFLGNKVNSSDGQSYYFYGISLSHFIHTLGNDNLAEGKPVNYTNNTQNLNFDEVDFTQYGQVIFAKGSNITIKNSNFSDDGLSFYYINNSIIQNNNFTTSKGMGILLHSNSNNNNLSNNEINTIEVNYGHGIYLDESSTNTISNNTITTSGSYGYGIYLYTSSNSNTLSNNTITTSGNRGHGIYLYSSSNNTIPNNTVTTSGDYGYGIRLYTSSNSNTLSNNTITTSGSSGYGIYLVSSSNSNTVSSNTITISGSSGYGIYLDTYSNNNSFSGMNIKTNNTNGYAIYIYDTNHNFTITDSILNSSYAGVREFYVRNAVTGGIWNFTNVTRSAGERINISWIASANGTLNMKWWLEVNVTDGTNPLSGANVSVYDVNNNLIWNQTTDASGHVSKNNGYALLEYDNINNTLITYYSNYTVNTTATGYSINSQTVNLTTNQNLNVVMSGGADTAILENIFIGLTDSRHNIQVQKLVISTPTGKKYFK